MEKLAVHIESLVFIAKEAISLKELKYNLDSHFNTKFKLDEIKSMLDLLVLKYQSEGFAMEIVHIAGGYKFLTKASYQGTVGTYLKNNTKKKLSKAAMEVLAIIAYKQPVAKSEVEFIRGVSCDYSIKKLLEKELLEITGRDQGPGRPLLYGTSDKFMDYFGLANIEDMPKPKEFKLADVEAGLSEPIDNVVENNPSQEE